MKHKLLAIMLALFATASLSAQVKVTGIVKDDTGQGVIGASVMEKGTTNGAVTDLDPSVMLPRRFPSMAVRL